MGTCRISERLSPLISEWIGVCSEYLRVGDGRAKIEYLRTHMRGRVTLGLPAVPRRQERISCNLCSAECRFAEQGDIGFCGLKVFRDNRLQSLSTPNAGLLHDCLDPHITNCCNSWFCPGGTDTGIPGMRCTESLNASLTAFSARTESTRSSGMHGKCMQARLWSWPLRTPG